MSRPTKIFLFVPATRPERFDKAFASGADDIIIDWEDTVAAADKAAARTHTLTYARSSNAPSFWLRLNAARSPHHADDLRAAAEIPNLKGVILGKTETAAEIESVYQALGKPVIADIESAQGMAAVAELAQAKGTFALTYGCLDLANDLGIRYGSPAAAAFFDRLRSDLLLHSRINRLHPPLETTLPDFQNPDIMHRHTRHWHDMGFGGVLCIHPKQVAATQTALAPTEATLAFAQEVVQQAEHSGAAVFQVNGQMVDEPVIAWAKQVLAENR
ncbi:HpcH/HpaI aldolase/citrate lyase family protein [Neisseria lisongii]|uniref:CoA ester lyase n=1 Tax=Neisseria lisongii TaxID=2912188 RepID=A0AAW5AK43_9NEIS|nr:CoA ester lyase [Neisseria lisongii]MCF7530272.1 CoA ester lyase [Neisseria lisongii]